MGFLIEPGGGGGMCRDQGFEPAPARRRLGLGQHPDDSVIAVAGEGRACRFGQSCHDLAAR
jgi:hypothetical protein